MKPIFRKVLILSPHTDDAELACGGSIARFIEENISVYVIFFSNAKESLPPDSDPMTLPNEFSASMDVLGVPQENIAVLDYPVRNLAQYRQAILDDLLKIRHKFNPDVILLPSGHDLHQDHQVLFAEGLRAFKDLTIWGYELPWNHITFSAQAFVELELRHISQKWKALEQYKSQINDMPRLYFNYDFFESLAKVRGTQIKAKYAEAFEVIRIRY